MRQGRKRHTMKSFFQSMFSKEAINTGRQSELDWFKAFAIMWMIQCHVEEVIFSRFWEDRAFVSGSMLLLIPMLIGISSWAFGFMFSMGTTSVYSHSRAPEEFVSRGFRLLAAWLVLRLLYIFPLAVHFASDSGVSVFRYAAKYLLSSDILCFAGLFFIYYGFLLKRAAAHAFTHIYIGGLSLLLFVAGQFIECPVSGIISVLCGNFMRSATSSFPFLCWLPAPLFGICWGKVLIHCRNKDRLYGCTGILSLAGLGIILLVLGKEGMLTQAGLHELNVPSIYYRGSVKTTAAAVIIFMLCLSIFYFLSRLVQWSWATRFIRFMSSNLTVIYFAQWIIIPRLALLLPTPDAPVSGRISVCISAAVVCLSALCALAWPKVLNRLKKTKAGKFI